MTTPLVPKVVLVVCDSWGVGDAPDAAAYGDEGSDTLANTARAVGGVTAPNLEALGLGTMASFISTSRVATTARMPTTE